MLSPFIFSTSILGDYDKTYGPRIPEAYKADKANIPLFWVNILKQSIVGTYAEGLSSDFYMENSS
jgi:hypothetical protein